MTVKSWLNRAKRLDEEIDTLMDLKRTTSERLTTIVQNYNSDGSQSSKDPHKFDRLAEIDGEIDRKIQELTNVRQEIFDTISKVEDSRYRQILLGRYIAHWTWERIAVSINYSYKQTIRLHGYALIAVEQYIK